MEKQKRELINKMNELQKLIPDTIKAVTLLPEIEGGNLYTVLNPGLLRIAMDYNPKEYLKTRRKLAAHWQYKGHKFNKLTGDFFVYFQHRVLSNIELSLQLEVPVEYEAGTSCKLVEVGHKTEVIYGLECK